MTIVLNDVGAQVLYLVVTFLLPTLVAVVTKRLAAPRVKAVTLTVLTALAATLAPVLESGVLDVQASVLLFFQGLVVAVAAHYGVLKPAGVTGSTGAVAMKTAPEHGIGVAKPVNLVSSSGGTLYQSEATAPDPHHGKD